MSGVSLESHTTREFTAAHLTSFNQVKSLVDENKIVTSSCFSCSDDPEPANFKLRVLFNDDEHLQCFVVSVTRAVTIRSVQFALFDSNYRTLRNVRIPGTRITRNGTWGLDEMHPFSGLEEDVTWRLKAEVSYDGVSSNNDLDFIQPRDPDMAEQMLKLLEDAKDADVKFIVGNETIKAHKNILVARSTYFQRLFHSGMQESSSKEIRVDDVAPAIFKELLKFVYSGSAPKNVLNIGMKLLPVADRYGLDVLKNMCESAIGSLVTVDNVIEVLLLANLHNCPKLRKRCIPLFKANVSSLKRSESWGKLKANPDLVVSLLESCL